MASEVFWSAESAVSSVQAWRGFKFLIVYTVVACFNGGGRRAIGIVVTI
jgi:hypothetical protein